MALEESHETLTILFLISCLLIGSVCRLISSYTPIPYTPLLLLFGFLCANSEIANVPLSFSPHGILYLFIPALIFHSAFHLENFLLKKLIFQIIIVAFLGVAINVGLIGFGWRVLLDNPESGWNGAFLFGSLISATDPVAVVALLKEIGAPISFELLLEGESLVNDGSAMVFFSIF